jgi:hypothetical protein
VPVGLGRDPRQGEPSVERDGLLSEQRRLAVAREALRRRDLRACGCSRRPRQHRLCTTLVAVARLAASWRYNLAACASVKGGAI